MNKRVCLIIVVSIAILNSACSQSPLARYRSNPTFSFAVEQGRDFVHRTVKRDNSDTANRVLHVYIEGDGRPWWTRYEIANDPTPRRLPMLELMAIDNNSALYLGRPCYFRLQDSTCEPQWWTQGRYSEAVVASMNAVLDKHAHHHKAVRLFGHSGGGALAMLLAARRDDVVAVVTLAGNLNIQAWTQHHRYSPLTHSLNPIDVSLSATIQQLHVVGSNDKSVPAWLVKQSARKLGNKKVSVIDGIDHSCCWRQQWPDILKQLSDRH